jgi:hypothetical protein
MNKQIAKLIRELVEAVCATNVSDKILEIADEIDPPNVKPLLADAKVGDLVKRRDGQWMQIDEIDDKDEYLPPSFRCRGRWWSVDGQSVHDVCSLDIIEYQLLASEGTSEWAWQMMQLGHKVTKDNRFCYYVAKNRRIACSMLPEILENGHCSNTLKGWQSEMYSSGGDGWEIYETLRCNYNGECANQRDDNTTLTMMCSLPEGKCKYQSAPTPRFEVGQWVNHDEYGLGYITFIGTLWCNMQTIDGDKRVHITTLNPIPAADVVLDFGSGLKGKIRRYKGDSWRHDWIDIFGSDVNRSRIASIRVEAITDDHMRSVVEQLLARQEEEK